MAKICVPLVATSLEELKTHFMPAQEACDMVEIWLDSIADTQRTEAVQYLIEHKKKPLLYKVTDARKLGKEHNGAWCDYIDLDHDTSETALNKSTILYKKALRILSWHNYSHTPETGALAAHADAMLKKGADIIKIATTAHDMSDTLRMLAFLTERAKMHPCICLCMGKEGRLTRSAGHLCGNYLMFAALTEEQATASGQLTVDELRAIYQITEK